MDYYQLPSRIRDYVLRTASFHSYASPGVLIGVFMVDYALDLLGAEPGEKLFAVCETHKCVPDALQVIAGCTTGNNRLRLVPIGKFALTLSRGSRDSSNGRREGPCGHFDDEGIPCHIFLVSQHTGI